MRPLELQLRALEDELRVARAYESQAFESAADEVLDDLDRSTLEQQSARSGSRIEFLRGEIEAVRVAILRGRRGEYGICEDCGERIERARLRALPSARLCVPCQSEEESMHRRVV